MSAQDWIYWTNWQKEIKCDACWAFYFFFFCNKLNKFNKTGAQMLDSHMTIFTFSKQAFNESLDFCNRSYSHEKHKFDWQLPSSLEHAIRFEPPI